MDRPSAWSELAELKGAVVLARAGVVVARSGEARLQAPAVRLAQRLLWEALEEYASALERCGYPLPHAISRDLAVYRGMFTVHGRDVH